MPSAPRAVPAGARPPSASPAWRRPPSADGVLGWGRPSGRSFLGGGGCGVAQSLLGLGGAGEHDDLDPAVLRPVERVVVRYEWLLVGVAGRGDAVGGDAALLDEVAQDRGGAAGRQLPVRRVGR